MHRMNAVGTVVALGVAVVVAYVSTVVTVPACGENQEPCTATSGPVLAATLAWAGLAAVVVVVLLVRSGRRVFLAVVITAAIYGAWLVIFVHEVTEESPPSPGISLSESASGHALTTFRVGSWCVHYSDLESRDRSR